MILWRDDKILDTVVNVYSAIMATLSAFINLIAACAYRSRLKAFNLRLNMLEITEENNLIETVIQGVDQEEFRKINTG